MQVLPLVTELLFQVEVRNQQHPMRLYGTLARGGVWSCLNHATWAFPDLARILRWGVGRGLIERAEARRMWTLMRMLEGPQAEPPLPGAPGPGERAPDPALRTQLHVLHGLARPWQEWVTEKINRTQEENT